MIVLIPTNFCSERAPLLVQQGALRNYEGVRHIAPGEESCHCWNIFFSVAKIMQIKLFKIVGVGGVYAYCLLGFEAE